MAGPVYVPAVFEGGMRSLPGMDGLLLLLLLLLLIGVVDDEDDDDDDDEV